MSERVPSGIAPALFTRMSTSGKASKTLSTFTLCDRSAANMSTRTLDVLAIAPLAALRSAVLRAIRTTLQPSSAITPAVARPIPFVAPLISAVLPASLRSIAVVSKSGNEAGCLNVGLGARTFRRATITRCAVSPAFVDELFGLDVRLANDAAELVILPANENGEIRAA